MALPRIAPYIAVLLLGAGLSACSGGSGTGKIKVGTVGRSDVAEVVSAPASVSARAGATLRAPAAGTIRQLQVTDGDTVRAGRLLATIDSPAARDQLRQAEEADRSLAGGGTAVPAGMDLSGLQKRTDTMAKGGFTAARRVAAKIPDPGQRALVLAEITKAEGQYAAAAGAARSAVARLNTGLGSVSSAMASIAGAQRVQTKAAVRAAQRVVDGLQLRAPFDGTVGLGGPAGGAGGLGGLAAQLPAQLQGQAAALGGGALAAGGSAKEAATVARGAPIESGDAIVTVTDVSRLALSADVDENNILQVKRGAFADVSFDAVPDATYRARVTGIGVTPKQATGGGVTYQVTLALQGGTHPDGAPAPTPKPGMSATVGLKVREAKDVLSVPSAAIVTSGRDATVWVLSPGGAALRRVVQVGAQGDATVQVTSGLKEGDRIVVRGTDAVKQGQKMPAA